MARAKKNKKCPRCNSGDVLLLDSFDDGIDLYVCEHCDHDFEVGGHTSRHREVEFDFDDDLDLDAFDQGLRY
jgi:transposase-like protein